MPLKKRIFTKNNSVKLLLLRGNPEATNADGETLKNILVPVSKNYKTGSSLLMSNIASMFDATPLENEEKEPDLKKMLEEFDANSENNDDGDLTLKMEQLSFNQKPKSKFPHALEENLFEDGFDNYSDEEHQFSEASDISDLESNIPEDCPETLKLFNARFEKVLEEYEDDQIGPLDYEDICGYLSNESKRAKDIIDSEINHKEEKLEFGNYEEDLKEKILNYAEHCSDEEIVEIVTEKPLEFDCESILSTYSNKYNHPTVIKEEKVQKIKISNNPMKKKLTKSQLKTLHSESGDEESDDDVSVVTSINIRQKGETPEEKRLRKSLFKEAKRESRMLKKENKLAFRKEKKLQKSQQLNLQHNLGIKLL